LRRFTFKIQFKPLTALQREAMFVTEALAGDGTALTDALRARLARLEQLCPGDFAAVKRQTDILATAFSVEEFLDQLEAEHRIKPEVREGPFDGVFAIKMTTSQREMVIFCYQ
jgi:aspartate oxidase